MSNQKTNFDSIPQIVYPDGSFNKMWDRVIFTGEVFRATVNKNQVKEGDPNKKSYDISIKLSPESFKELKAMRLDSTDKDGKPLGKNDRALTGLKKVELTKKDEEGNPILDEMGDPVKEFSHYQVTLRQNGFITKGGEKSKVLIPVVMADTNEEVDGFLQEGSKVSVLGQAYETTFRDNPAMGLNLKEVKVHEAVLYEGSGNGGGSDPWAALGLTSAVVEKAASEADNQDNNNNNKEVAPAKQANNEPNFDDFDDDIPF